MKWVVGVWLVAVIGSWQLLASVVPVCSERFHVLLPPAFLTAYLLLRRDNYGTHLRPAVWLLLIVTFLCVVVSMLISGVVLPDGVGWTVKSLRPGEVLVAVYFLTSITLLVIAVRFLLVRLCHWLSTRLADDNRPKLRRFLRDDLPVLLLLPIFLPYFPGLMLLHRYKIANPAMPLELLGRAYQDVSLRTDDGLTIRGWFIPAQQPSERTMLLIHGIGNNRTNALTFHEAADALRANLFLIDLRGHGDSDGHTISLGWREKLDVLAAVCYLRTERPGQARVIIGMGISMGSSGLLAAASEIDPPLDGIILDSAFASVTDLTDGILFAVPGPLRPCLTLPGLPLASFTADCTLADVRPVDRIGAIRAPVLIIHARNDALVPVDHANRLHESAVAPKTLWVTDTGNHGSSWMLGAEYARKIRDWFDSSLRNA